MDHPTIHRELHTGVMYTCSQFEKVFSLKSSLRRHIQFIQVNTNVQYVADVVDAVNIWKYTDEVILERNYLNVLFATSDFQHHAASLCTAEFTVERNHTNVMSVTRLFVSLIIWTIT